GADRKGSRADRVDPRARVRTGTACFLGGVDADVSRDLHRTSDAPRGSRTLGEICRRGAAGQRTGAGARTAGGPGGTPGRHTAGSRARIAGARTETPGGSQYQG